MKLAITCMASQKEEKDEILKWANFICPSCSIAYGINALVRAIRRRQQQQKVNRTNTPVLG
jgi:hypothetical protein